MKTSPLQSLFVLWAASAMVVACSDTGGESGPSGAAADVIDSEVLADVSGDLPMDTEITDGGTLDAQVAQDTTLDAEVAQDTTLDAQDAQDVPLEETETVLMPPLSSELAIACEDTSDGIYVTPEGALDADVDPGDVLRCTQDNTWSQSFMSGSLSVVGTPALYGVEELRVAFRTERDDEVPGASTAFVLLPEPRPSEPMDIIVWAHGTTGLADICAPSRYPGYYGYLPYAFAAQGYAVIGPDYAGLGNEGIQGYGDARDTAHSLLDAPGALTELLGPDKVTGKVVMAGHSQGGGAVLNAQALEASYGMEGELMGVINFAGTVNVEEEPTPLSWMYAHLYPVNIAGGAPASFGALYVYAYLANALGEDQVGLFFTPDWKSEVTGWIETMCIGDIIGAFSLIDGTVMFDDLYEPSFYAGILDCINGAESCEAPYEAYVAALKDNYIPLDPEGGRVLTVAGLLDQIVTASSIACVVDEATTWGLEMDLCVDPLANHGTVVDTHIGDALVWTSAVLAGEEPPACASQGTLPPCD